MKEFKEGHKYVFTQKKCVKQMHIDGFSNEEIRANMHWIKKINGRMIESIKIENLIGCGEISYRNAGFMYVSAKWCKEIR